MVIGRLTNSSSSKAFPSLGLRVLYNYIYFNQSTESHGNMR